MRFAEGLTDEQVISQFKNARKSDYEKVIKESNHLLALWSSGNIDPQDPSVKADQQVEKLQRQFDGIAAIDFFKAPERGTASLLLRDLAARSSGEGSDVAVTTEGLEALKNKLWVTRKNLYVDRIACGWLIRRFVDETASFKYVNSDAYAPRPGEIRFDMFEGEYTHDRDRCTFEVMINRLGLQSHGLSALAEVIHDIDLKENKYDRSETDGLNALLTGLAASEPDDDKRMVRGAQRMEHLYAFFLNQKGHGLFPNFQYRRTRAKSFSRRFRKRPEIKACEA